MTFLQPVQLTGDLVVLDPLSVDDHDALVEAATDGELWMLTYTGVPRPGEMRSAIDRYLVQQANATMMAFTVRRRNTGQVIGMTTFCNVDAGNRHVEIGYTWMARSAHRSGANTECKLLLLTHAFEQLDCIAVEFRTHWLNQQSRRALERLGAKQDGVLRSHKIQPDGSLRDTVVFSILQRERARIAGGTKQRGYRPSRSTSWA